MSDDREYRGPRASEDPRAREDVAPVASGGLGTPLTLALVALLLAPCTFLLLPLVVGPSTELVRRVGCSNNLKQIGVAMIAYEADYRSLPPAYVADKSGKPLYSWRVLLLPFLDQLPAYRRFHLDEPWDSPHNRPLGEDMPSIFRCPGQKPPIKNLTTYMVIVGEHAAFPGKVGLPLRDIKDGLDRTLLLVETQGPGVCWTSPVDVDLDSMTYPVDTEHRAGIGGPHRDSGGNAAFCDGHVQLLSHNVAPMVLRQLAIRDDGEPKDDSKY